MAPKKPTKPPHPPEPPDFIDMGVEADPTPSGEHVWIDNELYSIPGGVEVIRARKLKRIGVIEEDAEPTPPTPIMRRTIKDESTEDEESADDVGAVMSKIENTLLGFLLKSKMRAWSVLLTGGLISFLTGVSGGGLVGSKHAQDDAAMEAQIATLTAALADTSADLKSLRAEYALHKETHDRLAYQVETLTAQVRELTALENELHPRH